MAQQSAAVAQQSAALAEERVIFAEQRVTLVEQHAAEVTATAESRLREYRDAEARSRVVAAERDAALAQLGEAVAQAEARVRSEFESTKSWKVTMPLRVALRLVDAYRQRSS